MRKKTTLTTAKQPREYGALTDVSKGLNKILGDESGRSVSMRTAQGFKDLFNLPTMDDESAEDLVHGLMTAAPILLSKKNDLAIGIGIIILAGLLGSYLCGKELS